MIGMAPLLLDCGDFAKTVQNTRLPFGRPWGRHADDTEAQRDTTGTMMAGAQSVSCGYSEKSSRCLPVICHLGLVPSKVSWTGVFKAAGKPEDHAGMVWQQAKDSAATGAFAVEMEVIPAALAEGSPQRASKLTISLGSGGGCAALYLCSKKLLGEIRGPFPCNAKVYRNCAVQRDEMQQVRISASRKYITDAKPGFLPDTMQSVAMNDTILDRVRKD